MLTEDQITAQNFKSFYNEIRPYLNGQVPTFANQFSRSDLYSTDEKIIGQWIDGKPLYKRTLLLNNPPSGAGSGYTAESSVDTLNVEKIVNVETTFISNANQTYAIPVLRKNLADDYSLYMFSYTYNNNRLGIYFTFAGNKMISDAAYGIKYSYATFYYTKTTDSAIKVGTGTDYSTDEQIIGTWIDGKPLYQKTVTGNTSSSAGWETHDLGIGANVIDKVVSLDGVLYSTSGWHVGMGSGEANNELKFEVKPSTDKWEVYTGNIASHNNVPCVLTIRYTKTTD